MHCVDHDYSCKKVLTFCSTQSALTEVPQMRSEGAHAHLSTECSGKNYESCAHRQIEADWMQSQRENVTERDKRAACVKQT